MHNFNLFFNFNIFTDDLHNTIPWIFFINSTIKFQFPEMECYLVICWGQIVIYKYIVQFLQTYWFSMDIFKPFLLKKGFFAGFLLANSTIAVFETFFNFPIWLQASISLLDTFTSIISKISITFSSTNSWSSTLTGIPVISRLFLRPYCSEELLFYSREATFFSRLFMLLQSLWFLTFQNLIITYFKFSISLSKLSKRKSNVLSRLMISLDVSGVLFSFETKEFFMVW